MPKVDWVLLAKNLRSCQRECVDSIQHYLDSDYEGHSFLACLPTGAGKTGVIATVCQKTERRRVLVVCTRRAVRTQLREEIGGKFFSRQGGGEDGLRKVRTLGDSWEKEGIYVTTFQKLSLLVEEKLDKLLNDFDLMIVDEGHSEPAPVWSRISRKFQKHRVIITATPYRNDLFQFDVDAKHNYVYTFKAALHDRVLEEPAFERAEAAFVLARVAEALAAAPETRCIIKCRTYEDVVEFLRRTQAEGLRSIAMHERFKDTEIAHSFDRVPTNLREIDWKVAIHQHMLDEGVDVPEAKVLVLSYAVSSGRELVQAVGRVVRKFNDLPALVLDCSHQANEKMWRNYLRFDDYINDDAAWATFIRSLDVAHLLRTYQEAFPSIGYYGSSFKERFDLLTFDPDSHLKIPLASFCFIEVSNDFSIESACDTIFWRFHKNGELVRHVSSQNGFEVIISIRFDSSRYLNDLLFFQPTLEVVLLAQVNGRLALFDSRSSTYANDPELQTLSSISLDKLLKLASREDRVRTKEAAARAIGLATLRAERIGITGPDLELTPAGQRNAGYTLTTAKFDNYDQLDKRQSSYYVGVGSGRVSDQKNRNFDLAKLKEWLEDITDVLGSNLNLNSDLLRSFAMPLNYVPDSEPVAILVDLMALDADLELRVEDQAVVVQRGFLSLLPAGNEFAGSGLRLRWGFDPEAGRFAFSSEHEITCSETGESFISFINRAPVKAIFDGAISYVDGSFYKIVLPSERGVDIEETRLASRLVSLSDLQDLASEKGVVVRRQYVNTTNDLFDQTSVFAFLDKLSVAAGPDDSPSLKALRSEIPNCDLIICTDMGTEAADFILSSPSKLCFVHVKNRNVDNPQSSAGAIAEVGVQALKNLEHVISKNELLSPGNRALLNQKWPNDDAHPALAHRVRLIDGLNSQAYMQRNNLAEVREVMLVALELVAQRRKSDAYQKEIWVMVGKGFSRDHFVRQMRLGERANAESLQAFQLLDSWSIVAADHEVVFKVLTSP